MPDMFEAVPDMFEAVKNVFRTMVDNEPKSPLHILEASNCWTYLAFLNNAIGISQSAINMTTDEELSGAIHEELKLIQIQINDLKKFMIDEGVPLPPSAEEKPKAKAVDVPPGVKYSDNEIANELSLKIAAAIMACATAITESIRSDVGAMFSRFLMQKITYGTNLKVLMRKRGWIKIPPHYTPPGLPINDENN